MAPRYDDAEEYFGKDGEVIVCNLSGSRTVPRMGNQSQNRDIQESPRTPDTRYASSPYSSPQRSSGQGYASSPQYQDDRQSNASSFGTQQQYGANQAAYRQPAAAGPSYAQQQQYSAKAPGYYESPPASRYYQ